MSPIEPSPDYSASLEQILEHLRRMDRRDKLRTWGGFFRGIIGLIPVAVLLLSVWYFAKEGPALMESLMKTAAQQAATASVNATMNATKGAVIDREQALDLLKQLQR